MSVQRSEIIYVTVYSKERQKNPTNKAIGLIMWNLNRIVELEYDKNYVYYIKFDNGLECNIDFSTYLERGEVFQVLSDICFFKQAKIEGGTISWPNGLDIAPERIYEKCKQCATPNLTL